MELGVYTFAALNPDPATGRVDAGRRLRELVEDVVARRRAGGRGGADGADPVDERGVRAELRRSRVAREAGHDPATLPVGINSHAYVAETSERAADEFFPAYAAMMTRIGRERGWPPMTRGQFDQLRSPRGALVVGSPQEVAEKILFQHDLFGHDRFLAQMSVGTLPHAQALRSIELFGTEVAPIVRAEVARRHAAAA